MKRKGLIFAIGLMSLIVMSSCEDHYEYDKEKNFMPLAFEAKVNTEEDVNPEGVATTLSVLGVKALVFDEIEKTDWKIITQSSYVVDQSNEALVIDGKMFAIDDDENDLLAIPTNHEDILVTLGNTQVTYNYMGKEIILYPMGGMNLSVVVEETKCVNDPAFFQTGYIVFRLFIGYVPVKIHKMPFIVFDKEKFTEDMSIEMPDVKVSDDKEVEN